MPRRPIVVGLDQIEHLPGPGTLTWLPVRHTLGLRAFGTNAYVAREAGQEVVEPHTENPVTAHEELYFVARGRATFTIDGEAYAFACVEAVSGDGEAAIGWLRRAAELKPDTVRWAREDEDFTALRDRPAFRALVDP